MISVLVSFRDEVLPDLAQTLQLISVHIPITVLIASWILQSEDGEELVDGGSVDGLEGTLGIVVSVEVVADGISSLLVSQFAEVVKAA